MEILASTSLEKRLLAINKTLDYVAAQKRRSVCVQSCEGLQPCQAIDCCQQQQRPTSSSGLLVTSNNSINNAGIVVGSVRATDIIVVEDDDDSSNLNVMNEPLS